MQARPEGEEGGRPDRTFGGRVAFRVAYEGSIEWWVAYFVPQLDSMDRAVELGRMQAKWARESNAAKESFANAMAVITAELIRARFGRYPAEMEMMPPPGSDKR